MCSQHSGYWCPGALAPGHQYPQCWPKSIAWDQFQAKILNEKHLKIWFIIFLKSWSYLRVSDLSWWWGNNEHMRHHDYLEMRKWGIMTTLKWWGNEASWRTWNDEEMRHHDELGMMRKWGIMTNLEWWGNVASWRTWNDEEMRHHDELGMMRKCGIMRNFELNSCWCKNWWFNQSL